jgi:hypothetical protein
MLACQVRQLFGGAWESAAAYNLTTTKATIVGSLLQTRAKISIHRTPSRLSLGLLTHPDRTPGAGELGRWASGSMNVSIVLLRVLDLAPDRCPIIC